MYYWCVLLFLFQNSTPEHIVEYHDIKNKTQEIEYITKYIKSNSTDIQAYVISLEMKQAEYKVLPWQKLNTFNKGKTKLEQLIIKDPKNANLIYVRLVIQEQLPKMLNYNSDIEHDKQFLSELLKIKDNSDYLDTYILNYTTL
ncbi:hypothetical protein [Algibacter lectus]|uniref:Uncharacterized protein n=1 Tax=Algibacter lectus TaxID=221126 RepID=A0A4R8MDR0_9FLAO|nr:hypothetical protein [Algibacter lectus]MWW23951.1 hypothetical protein [Algibacter lectus]TDY61966.1 hypothetical protein DFQ06_1777 [Algibacter lectus]